MVPEHPPAPQAILPPAPYLPYALLGPPTGRLLAPDTNSRVGIADEGMQRLDHDYGRATHSVRLRAVLPAGIVG